jgi:hypothetical protein
VPYRPSRSEPGPETSVCRAKTNEACCAAAGPAWQAAGPAPGRACGRAISHLQAATCRELALFRVKPVATDFFPAGGNLPPGPLCLADGTAAGPPGRPAATALRTAAFRANRPSRPSHPRRTTRREHTLFRDEPLIAPDHQVSLDPQDLVGRWRGAGVRMSAVAATIRADSKRSTWSAPGRTRAVTRLLSRQRQPSSCSPVAGAARGSFS